MPVVLRWGEPPQIHVLKERKQLKLWLRDLSVARNVGFAAHEVNVITQVAAVHRAAFLEAWNDHFGH